jgi:hypothetical protein
MKQEVFGVMRKMGWAESRSFPIDSAAGSFQTHQGHRNAANAPKTWQLDLRLKQRPHCFLRHQSQGAVFPHIRRDQGLSVVQLPR